MNRMLENISPLTVEHRTETCAALRKAGSVPGILYGGTQDNVKVHITLKNLEKVIQERDVSLRVFSCETHGMFMIKDIVFHKATRRPMHFDLLRVTQSTRLSLNVPLHFVNGAKSPALKRGGQLSLNNNGVLPLRGPLQDIPYLCIDLEGKEAGFSLAVKDLNLPASIRPTKHAMNHTLIHITAVRGS